MQYGNFLPWRQPLPRFGSLNRTMQYGNSPIPLPAGKVYAGLNRTMQYGNEFNSFLVAYVLFKFKSYYVVWKPFFLHLGGQQFRTFKSYYVVWKHGHTQNTSFDFICLNRTMQYGNVLLSLFRRQYYFGLNRTMQYGNFPGAVLYPSACQFKSYYVVWKLKYIYDKEKKKNTV